jgi:membrane fusion protein (multidrug efflux system)
VSTSLACALLFACSPTGGKTANGAERADETSEFEGLTRTTASKVLTAPLEQREMVRSISTTVNAESETEIQIFPRTSGIVVARHVEEGDRVVTGDILLEIDPREAQVALSAAEIALREAEDAKRALQLSVDETAAMIASAELTFEQSKRELKRKAEAGAGVISRNELDLLELNVATNEANLLTQNISAQKAQSALTSQDIAIDLANLEIERAQLDLSYTKVEAPFDGVIASRTVRIGDLASSATAAFVLTDTDNVRAVVSRAQREMSFFRDAEARARKASDRRVAGGAGLDIEILPEALPGATYTGRILFVSPTVDPTSGQFRVTIAIDQPEEGDERSPILPGMLLRIGIITERHPGALVIPKRALLREGDSHFVFIAKDGVADRVRVLEGFADDDFIEIIPLDSGVLTAGDAIVVVGNRDLEDGDRVEAAAWKTDPKPDAGESSGESGDDDDA